MANMDRLVQIRKELHANADMVYKKGSIRFFKEKINPIGVRTPVTRKIARTYYPKDISKKELFILCEQLLEKGTFEETLIAFDWVYKRKKELVATDFARFERWLKKYVHNWAHCDDFCTHAFGYILTHNPALIRKVRKWHTAKNRWLRRASAVILIHAMMERDITEKERTQLLAYIFDTADALLLDSDDLVQKGYGWMLKVASNRYQNRVFRFVLERKDCMPRTALRYAIEKYPKEMRNEAMK